MNIHMHLIYRLGAGPNGIEDIKHHEFFTSIDWDALLEKEVGLFFPFLCKRKLLTMARVRTRLQALFCASAS